MKDLVSDINRIVLVGITLSQINVAMLTQINVDFPLNLNNFFAWFDFVNFDLSSYTGARCDTDLGFRGMFSLMLLFPLFVVVFAFFSYSYSRAKSALRISRLKKSSHALIEFESMVCYEELFRLVDVDQSGLIDCHEFADLLRLCGFGKHVTEGLATNIIQGITESEFTTEISQELFISSMQTGNLGKVVATKLRQHGNPNTLLQDGEKLIEWNERRKLFNGSFSGPTQFMLLLHAPISRLAFQYFDCPWIGKKMYLRSDYELECQSDEWNSFLVVVITVLIVVVVGFPLILSLVVFWWRKELYSPWVNGKVGWLYSRFNRGSEWWEVHDMLRRMLLIGAVVTFPVSALFRACLCILISVVSILSLNYHKPYRNLIVFWVSQVILLSYFLLTSNYHY